MLRGAGIADWPKRLLELILPDKRMALVAALQVDPELGSDQERVDRFIQETGQSRPTYYRLKRGRPDPNPAIGSLTLSRRPAVLRDQWMGVLVPVDVKGRTLLVQDVKYYSKAALYDAFKAYVPMVTHQTAQ